MGSGTSFFDMTLFRRALRRWWPLGLAFCAALLYQCMGTLQMVNQAYWNGTWAGLSLALQSPLPSIFACAAAMLAYRYLHELRHSAFMAALPVRREAAFLSQGAAALAILLLGEILCAVLAPLFAGAPRELLPLMGRWLVITGLLTAAYFGFASLCAVLTGHSLVLPALYALGLYAAVALESSVRTMAQFLIFGLGSQQWKLTALSPVYYLKQNVWVLLTTEVSEPDIYGSAYCYATHFLGWGTLLAYLAAGIACLGLALFLLKKRPSEAAGNVMALRLLRPAFRVGCALASGCGAGMLLLRTVFGYNGYYAVTGSGPRVLLLFFLLLLGGFVGWFGAEMLLRKSLRVFDRHWLGYGVYAGLVLALVLGCELDIFRVERAVPAEEKIGYATLSCYEVGVDLTRFEEPENIARLRELHRTVVANKALFERGGDVPYVSGGAAYGYGYGYSECGTLILRYYDKAGKLLMVREYVAPDGGMAWASSGDGWYTGGWENPALAQLEALVNTTEAVEQRCLPREGMVFRADSVSWGSVGASFQDALGYYRYGDLMELSRSDVYELCTQALFPDLRDSSIGYSRLRPGYLQDLPEAGNVTVSLGMESGEQYWYWYGRLTEDARRTIAWLRAHGVELEADGRYVSAGDAAEADGW